MNCADVQQVLPEIIDGGQDSEFQAHLKSCPLCSELVSDLELIASEARQLADVYEPAPRVWVKIAAELRAEVIIREAGATPARPVLVPRTGRGRNAWWLVPVAAVLVVAGAYFSKSKQPPTVATNPAVVAPASSTQANNVTPAGVPSTTSATQRSAEARKAPAVLSLPKDSERDDQQFLDEVSRNAPMMRAAYENQLHSVNSYIRDAQAYAEQNPWDDDARQHVMDAYEQKSMLYQMALDNVQ
jgi:hypothetical protein